MKKRIAVLPGDGIGPEVIEQAIKVLDAVSERFEHQFNYCFADIGARAIDKHGASLPDETFETCMQADAILFGAVGDPKYDNNPNLVVRPEQGLLALRKKLELFCNIRPVNTYASLRGLSPFKEKHIKDVNFVIFRELCGGIYFGEKGINEAGTEAYDKCIYNEMEIIRIAKMAFESAMQRRKKLTLVDKSNVLETSRLWRKTVTEMSHGYPDVQFNCMFVDNAIMQMMIHPGQFDVVLTDNMFGDILSEGASVLAGSLGMLPSASIGAEHALFEPIHGSFPRAAGEDIANPMAAVLSAAMMLEHFGMKEEADCVYLAIHKCLEEGISTRDLNTKVPYSCSQVGDVLSSLVLEEMLHFKGDQLRHGVSTII